jgi:hypothetical protein
LKISEKSSGTSGETSEIIQSGAASVLSFIGLFPWITTYYIGHLFKDAFSIPVFAFK